MKWKKVIRIYGSYVVTLGVIVPLSKATEATLLSFGELATLTEGFLHSPELHLIGAALLAVACTQIFTRYINLNVKKIITDFKEKKLADRASRLNARSASAVMFNEGRASFSFGVTLLVISGMICLIGNEYIEGFQTKLAVSVVLIFFIVAMGFRALTSTRIFYGYFALNGSEAFEFAEWAARKIHHDDGNFGQHALEEFVEDTRGDAVGKPAPI